MSTDTYIDIGSQENPIETFRIGHVYTLSYDFGQLECVNVLQFLQTLSYTSSILNEHIIAVIGPVFKLQNEVLAKAALELKDDEGYRCLYVASR